MTSEIIVELYIRATLLASLEREMSGHSNETEWPLSHYEAIMEAAERYYELLQEAIEALGEDEVQKRYDHFVSNLDVC